MESNASNCSATVGTAKMIASLYSSFAALATIMYVIAIVLIIKTRAYQKFIHRLTLYLCFGGLFRALSLGFEVVPVDLEQSPDSSPAAVRAGWDAVCALSGFLVQYSGLLQTSIVVWISVYLFVTVLFPKRIEQRSKRHEVAGLVAVVLAPLLLAWEPFLTHSYGLWGTICWIKDNPCHINDTSLEYNAVYALWLVSVPHVTLTQLSLLLMGLALLALSRRVYKKILKHRYHHWYAIKEIAPLMLYPIVYSAIFFGRMVGLLAGNSSTLFGEVTVCLIQLCSATLPLSLLVRSSVRSALCRVQLREEEKELSTAVVVGTDYAKF